MVVWWWLQCLGCGAAMRSYREIIRRKQSSRRAVYVLMSIGLLVYGLLFVLSTATGSGGEGVHAEGYSKLFHLFVLILVLMVS